MRELAMGKIDNNKLNDLLEDLQKRIPDDLADKNICALTFWEKMQPYLINYFGDQIYLDYALHDYFYIDRSLNEKRIWDNFYYLDTLEIYDESFSPLLLFTDAMNFAFEKVLNDLVDIGLID